MVIQGVSYPSDFEAKKQMIEAGKRLDQKGYVIATEGSLSVRVGPNAVWITAEGAVKGELKQENFVRVDLNGKQTPGSRQNRVPEDLALHLQVYEQNPALRCIVHAYPPEGVVLAEQGSELPAADLTPAVRQLGAIPVSLQSGEEAVRQAVLICKTQSGMVIRRDGCVMWGETLREAMCRMETLEYYGKVSRMMGSGPAGCRVCQQKTCRTGSAQADMPVRTERSAPAGSYGEGNQPVWQKEAVQAGAVDGLTGIIRPGMPFPAAGGGQPQKSETGEKQLQRPTTAAGQSQRPVVQPFQEAAGVQPLPAVQSFAGERRKSMMDEVVRQSLARLKP